MTVGVFTITPTSGPPGTTLELDFDIDEAIPGLSTVDVLMDGDRLGEPVTLTGSPLRITRTVPSLAPGTYRVEVRADEATLSAADFTVTESRDAAATGSDPWIWVALLALVGGALVWYLVDVIRHPRPSVGLGGLASVRRRVPAWWKRQIARYGNGP